MRFSASIIPQPVKSMAQPTWNAPGKQNDLEQALLSVNEALPVGVREMCYVLQIFCG